MYPNVNIVVLSKYPEIFEGLQNNLEEYAKGHERILVQDGYLLEKEEGWLNIQGPPGKFVFSVNANIGLKATDPTADVLLMGDDVRLRSQGTIEALHTLAYSDLSIGLLSPRIIGGADNPMLTQPPQDVDISYTNRYIPLVCTYIKRSVIKHIGYLDERFNEAWGYDDTDFSRRAYMSGFKLAVTPLVEVTHGLRKKGSESLIRNEKGDSAVLHALDAIHARIYSQKWGDVNKEW